MKKRKKIKTLILKTLIRIVLQEKRSCVYWNDQINLFSCSSVDVKACIYELWLVLHGCERGIYVEISTLFVGVGILRKSGIIITIGTYANYSVGHLIACICVKCKDYSKDVLGRHALYLIPIIV